jgi:hypothetical protein
MEIGLVRGAIGKPQKTTSYGKAIDGTQHIGMMK